MTLLGGTRRQLTAPFVLLVTASRVRSYKPAPPHFTAARERIGGRRWLHAARSYFHDVEPAVGPRDPRRVDQIAGQGAGRGAAARPGLEHPTL